MPVVTRSLTTSSSKKMSGVKRKFVEILDSDDDTVSTSCDSDSEFEPNVAEELEDEIDELKKDLKDSESSNDAILNMLIKEREINTQLRNEIEEAKERLVKLMDNVKALQRASLCDLIYYTTILSVTVGMCAASIYRTSLNDDLCMY